MITKAYHRQQELDLAEGEAWWTLASDRPFEAMKSPMFGIATLSEPERWIELIERGGANWINLCFTKMRIVHRERFAADILGHCWWMLEESDIAKGLLGVNYRDVERAIEVRGAHGRQLCDVDEWNAIRERVLKLMMPMINLPEYEDEAAMRSPLRYLQAIISPPHAIMDSLYNAIHFYGSRRLQVGSYGIFQNRKAPYEKTTPALTLWAWQHGLDLLQAKKKL